jgi:AraC-like DNA-binding protein
MVRTRRRAALDRPRRGLGRPRQGGWTRTGAARGLRAFLARYPALDPDALLREAGVGPRELADPDARIPFARNVALFERAARESGDSALGLAYAIQLPWQDLGVVGYVVLHSATLGAALANACRYHAIQQTSGGATLEVGPRLTRLRYTPGDPSIGPHAQNSEIVIAMYTRLCREAAGFATWAPREVHFRHRAPADPGPQRRFFAAPVHYRRDEDAMILATADLRAPMKTADPDLLAILLRHAERSLAELPAADDFLAGVRRAVIDELGAGEATIERIAERLETSARSLQRRLREEGRSFKELVAETRLALARRYLADPSLSLTDTAYLLGYSDLSAFSRAFRRWTGISAIELRRRGRSSS